MSGMRLLVIGMTLLATLAPRAEEEAWLHLGDPLSIDDATPIRCLVRHPQ